MWQFADLRFAEPMFCAIDFHICDLQYSFCELKTSANPQLLYMIKMFILKFYLKVFNEQARGLILAGFTMKWPTRTQLLKRGCLILGVLYFE